MRCPVCKAENVQGPQCRRCKADLTPLAALEVQRRGELEATRRCLAGGDWVGAARHVAEADWLQTDDESRRLVAVARLLCGDYAAAWEAYQSLCGRPGPGREPPPESDPRGR
jgi:hypothetical protein